MKIDATKLREYLNTMHGHADARDVQSDSIRRVIQAAKTDGFDGKALRKVFVRERMDPEQRQKDDETVSVYEAALGAKGRALKAIEAGAGVEEAAKANGLHRATVSRARNVAKQVENATPAHDPDTGEIAETAATAGRPGDGDTDAAAEGPSPAVPVATPISESSGGVEGHAGLTHPTTSGEPEAPSLRKASKVAEGRCGEDGAGIKPGPLDTQPDGLDIPPFLRRVKAA